MATMNRVFLLGNLTKDPETKQFDAGSVVANMRLAVSRKFTTRAGKEAEETCFVDVVTWGNQAQACGKYLSKGSPILVEGRLQYEEWEKDGKKQSRIRVHADRVQFLGRPRNESYASNLPPEDTA